MKKLLYLISLLTLSTFMMFLYGGCSKDEAPVTPTTTTTTVATRTTAIMMKFQSLSFLILLLASTTTTTQATTATGSGVGSLPAGVNGSISNTRVALYTSVDDWNFDRTFAFTACDGNGNYTLSNLTPGVYYMDAWKDNDNDGVWGTGGDYVWVNGSGAYPNYTLSPLQFSAGQVTTVNFEVFVVP